MLWREVGWIMLTGVVVGVLVVCEWAGRLGVFWGVGIWNHDIFLTVIEDGYVS